MHQEFLMGNEAIALGAMAAGVNLVAGYPGTPSTEVLETIAKRNPGHIHVEWSINEKAAMEVGAGAAYSGARVLVTMKQVGLNVASDHEPFLYWCKRWHGSHGGRRPWPHLLPDGARHPHLWTVFQSTSL